MDHQLFRSPDAKEGETGSVPSQEPSRNSIEATDVDLSSGSKPSQDKGMGGNDDSFSELPSFTSETNSFTGEEHETPSGAANKDRLRYVDVSTPTLIDEMDEEEEAEMVSLEQERLLRSSAGIMAKENSAQLRRTPGASMYASTFERSAAHRRTPGASSMHKSAVVKPSASKRADDGILGFGLTLSTPVTNDSRGTASKRADDESSSSSSSVSAVLMEERAVQDDRSPGNANATEEGRGIYSYTPAGLTLSKNPNLEFSRGAFSPNTIRLTETLDNLLLDDEDNTSTAAPGVFQPEASSESWAHSFNIDSEVGKTTTSKKSSRTRRGRNQRGNKSFSGGQGDSGALFSPQQQKPLPQAQAAGPTDTFGGSSLFRPPSTGEKKNLFAGADEERPTPLNFGGAFVPPSQANLKNFKRPVASAPRGPGFEASVAAASQPPQDRPAGRGEYQLAGGSQPFVPLTIPQQPQYSGVQRTPSLPGNQQAFAPQHYVGPMDPSQGPSSGFRFHTHGPGMEYPSHGFSPQSIAMSSNASVGTPSISPFQMNPPGSQSYGQEYMYNMQNQQPPSHHFPPPPHWGHVVPMPYDTAALPSHRDAGWHSPGWGGPHGDYGMYGMPQMRMENPHGTQLSPTMEQCPPSYAISMSSRVNTPDFDMQRPRVRSVDALSPVTIPVPARGRMASWDHGDRDKTVYLKKEGQQRKSSLRRQRQSEGVAKPKFQSKGKKSASADDKQRASDGRKKNAPMTPKKKKSTKIQMSTFQEANLSSRQRTLSIGSKREGSAADSDRATPALDDSADLKRAELVESPATRSAFKTFYRTFRAKERGSFQEAEEFALESLRGDSVPENVRWRVYLELADLAKRANKFDEARKLYKQVCDLQPYASQGWLEYSKLEEECGHLNRCTKILHSGLEHCEISESLLTRAIKHEEKIGNIDNARQLLARLKHVNIEKVWRTVLEGALLEARAGNDVMARRVLKYLMHHVPWYGPLYLEAYRLERDLGRPGEALLIVERGLNAIPRYGPLWFGAFRLCETLDMSEKLYKLPRTLNMFDRATDSISRELVWKVHLDAAQILERTAIQVVRENPMTSLSDELALSRQRFAKTVLTCPPNLCWKVWLAGGRMELAAGNTEAARRLFCRANEVVPEKGRAAALLECSRLEEFVDNTDVARSILLKTRSKPGSDWKVWLESVLIEIRSGESRRATELARHALDIHSGTGRLWAALVQLRQVDGEEVQISSLRSALKAVPKSGEVWCEGARIHLNPLSLVFDLDKARQHLLFATKFTPQYGDSFLETLRLELVDKWISPVATNLWEALKNSKLATRSVAEMGVDEILLFVEQCLPVAVRAAILDGERKEASRGPKESATRADHDIIDPDLIVSCRELLDVKTCFESIDLSEVELRCANADPNYGLLWFHCREGPTDTARVVLARAKEKIAKEMSRDAHLYVAAIIRRSGVIAALKTEIYKQKDGVAADVIEDNSEEFNRRLYAKLLVSPSIESILRAGNTDEEADMVLLEKSTSASDFITGLVELNKFTPLQSLSLQERRKTLFGSDSLLS